MTELDRAIEAAQRLLDPGDTKRTVLFDIQGARQSAIATPVPFLSQFLSSALEDMQMEA